METNTNESLFDLEFDAIVKSHIEGVAKWAKVIAYITFVSYGVNLLAAILGKTSEVGAAAGLGSAILTLIIGGILNYFLLKFANHAQIAVQSDSQTDIEIASENLNYYNKMTGILLLIVLVFVVLAFLVAGLFNMG